MALTYLKHHASSGLILPLFYNSRKTTLSHFDHFIPKRFLINLIDPPWLDVLFSNPMPRVEIGGYLRIVLFGPLVHLIALHFLMLQVSQCQTYLAQGHWPFGQLRAAFG